MPHACIVSHARIKHACIKHARLAQRASTWSEFTASQHVVREMHTDANPSRSQWPSASAPFRPTAAATPGGQVTRRGSRSRDGAEGQVTRGGRKVTCRSGRSRDRRLASAGDRYLNLPVSVNLVIFILRETGAMRVHNSPAEFLIVASAPATSSAHATSVLLKRQAMCRGVLPCRSL